MSQQTITSQAGRFARPAVAHEVKVWDLFVRIFHWSLASLFAVAWMTGEGSAWISVHTVAGYAIAGLVGLRVLWGLVGPKTARFTNFVYRPSSVLRYVKDVASGTAPRFLGHNPAGGAMIVALLVMLAITCITGYAAMVDAFSARHWLKEVHEAAVNVTILLIIGHLAGVIFSSFTHGENLIKAMITGKKRC